MAAKLKIMVLSAVLALLTLNSNTPGYAQVAAQPPQEAAQKALAQQAVREVLQGSLESLSKITDEQGD